jgi:hypothetical protein
MVPRPRHRASPAAGSAVCVGLCGLALELQGNERLVAHHLGVVDRLDPVGVTGLPTAERVASGVAPAVTAWAGTVGPGHVCASTTFPYGRCDLDHAPGWRTVASDPP